MNSPAPLEKLRFNMIEQQIRPWDVLDRDVLDLLAEIHREDFVPPAHRALAFFDMEIPLGDGSVPGQCMLSPRVEARTLQDLHVQKHESVLEIGTGSGFMAALLAHRAASVLTLEIDPALASAAADTLRRNGVANVEVRKADGSQPLASGPTFDVIVLSGSVARVPQNRRPVLRRECAQTLEVTRQDCSGSSCGIVHRARANNRHEGERSA